MKLLSEQQLKEVAEELGLEFEEAKLMYERALALGAGGSSMLKSYKSGGGLSKLTNVLKTAKAEGRHIVQSDGKQGTVDDEEDKPEEREKSIDLDWLYAQFTSANLNREHEPMERTKQMAAVQAHLHQNRRDSMRGLFASVSTLPDDEAIQAGFKQIEEVQGQSESYRNGLYDQFTSSRLNRHAPNNIGLQIRTKETLAQQQSVMAAQHAKTDAALKRFHAQQAEFTTPEQRRQATVDWHTRKI